MVTIEQLNTWFVNKQGQLLAVARRRNQIDPEDVVQTAYLVMLRRREERQKYEVNQLWPWAVMVIREVGNEIRKRDEERAEKSLLAGPLFLNESFLSERRESERVDGRYLGPIGFGHWPVGRIAAKCGKCTGVQSTHAEAGRDRLPTSGRHVTHIYGVVACQNGCRQYINLEDLELLPTLFPARAPGFTDAELFADARRSRPAHSYIGSTFERKVSFDRSERPLPEGDGIRLVCPKCEAENDRLWSCEHATEGARR